jgi:hypothetical protein
VHELAFASGLREVSRGPIFPLPRAFEQRHACVETGRGDRPPERTLPSVQQPMHDPFPETDRTGDLLDHRPDHLDQHVVRRSRPELWFQPDFGMRWLKAATTSYIAVVPMLMLVIPPIQRFVMRQAGLPMRPDQLAAQKKTPA